MARALPLYRGFSTANFLQDKKAGFMLTNLELVKQDLLNFIYTVPGERVGMPSFGTRIPLLTFEQADQKTLEIIKADLQKAVDYDPRLQLKDLSIQVLPDNNMIAAFMDLYYVELNITETLKLEFSMT
jgi:phage baseplate assembly protein W